jgi:hypothetical protein
VLPRWLLPVAAIAAVVSYLGWIAAASDDYTGKAIVTLIAATVFWLSLMVIAAFAVQFGVARRRDRDRR